MLRPLDCPRADDYCQRYDTYHRAVESVLLSSVTTIIELLESKAGLYLSEAVRAEAVRIAGELSGGITAVFP
jgi:hypothetical protein